MVSQQTFIITLICAVFASGGFWAFLTYLIQRRDCKNSVEGEMLRGIGHDRICSLGTEYIKQGRISKDEYENLYEYLYVPYRKLGGNGTAERIMAEVNRLPFEKEATVNE